MEERDIEVVEFYGVLMEFDLMVKGKGSAVE